MCKCMKCRKFQDVTSIKASLILVCLLRSALVASHHAVLGGPAAFCTGALCSTYLLDAASFRKYRSLQLCCARCYTHPWAVLSPSLDFTSGLCFNLTQMQAAVKKGQSDLHFSLGVACSFSPSLPRHWCLHSCRMSSLRLEFSQIMFLMHTGVLGRKVGSALLIAV